MLIVALTGRPGAGKDSVGKVLAAAGWNTCAFADALRVEVCAVWRGLDWRLLVERQHKESPTPQLAAGQADHAGWLHWCVMQGHSLQAPRSPRWVMQQWGTFRRGQRADYWVRQLRAHVDSLQLQARHHGHPMRLAITDLRMINEADAVREWGGHIVRVHRPDLRAMPAETAAHESEREAASITECAVVHNAGDLTELPAEVWRVVRPWLAADAAAANP